ncbi:MAG: hypothetical protein VB858_14625 [Planctomycetaceae bacterium]
MATAFPDRSHRNSQLSESTSNADHREAIPSALAAMVDAHDMVSE